MQPPEIPPVQAEEAKTDDESNIYPVAAIFMAVTGFAIGYLNITGGSLAIFGILLLPLWLMAIVFGICGIVRAGRLKQNRASAKILFWFVIAAFVGFIIFPIPGYDRSHTLARRAMSMTQLNGLGKALMLYQETNDGQLPTDVGLLVDEGMISVESFVYPGAGSEVEVVNGRLEGEPSYVIFLDDKFKDKSDAIRAYEKLRFTRHKGPVAVLTFGGNVKRVTIDELNKQLAEEGRPPAE